MHIASRKMVIKRLKLYATADLLSQEINVCLVNLFANKIYFNFIVKYLCKKYYYTNLDVESNISDDSSFSNNQLLIHFNFDSEADYETVPFLKKTMKLLKNQNKK